MGGGMRKHMFGFGFRNGGGYDSVKRHTNSRSHQKALGDSELRDALI